MYKKFILIIIGILITDFISAFNHWIEDNYLSYDSTIFSESAKSNTLHHYNPRAITCKSDLTFIFGKRFYYLTYLIIIIICSMKNYYTLMYIFIGIFISTGLPEINHKYAHFSYCERPPLMTFLYEHNILVNNKQHKCHHDSDYSKHRYGTFLSFTNYIYDDILDLWNNLEKIFPPCCKKTNNFPDQPKYTEKCPPPMTEEEKQFYENKLEKIQKKFSCCKKDYCN
jgi:hypothetical protein